MTNYYIIIVFFELQEFKIVFQSWKVKESEKLYEEKYQNILPLWAKISTKFIKKKWYMYDFLKTDSFRPI